MLLFFAYLWTGPLYTGNEKFTRCTIINTDSLHDASIPHTLVALLCESYIYRANVCPKSIFAVYGPSSMKFGTKVAHRTLITGKILRSSYLNRCHGNQKTTSDLTKFGPKGLKMKLSYSSVFCCVSRATILTRPLERVKALV